MNEKQLERNKTPKNLGTALGIVFGAGLGLMIGSSMVYNGIGGSAVSAGLGIVFGAGLGLIIGAALDRR